MPGNGNGRKLTRGPASVFIVEDEAIIAQDVRTTLEGEESVRRVGALHPDLVLMDIKIKGPIDGLQAGGEILTRFRIPVIFMSAYTDPDLMGASVETRRAPWIQKPFDARELRDALEGSLVRASH
jgi:CheY-like chemotaxis protein